MPAFITVVAIAKLVTESSLPSPRAVLFSAAGPGLLGQAGYAATHSSSPALAVTLPSSHRDTHDWNGARDKEGWEERKGRKKKRGGVTNQETYFQAHLCGFTWKPRDRNCSVYATARSASRFSPSASVPNASASLLPSLLLCSSASSLALPLCQPQLLFLGTGLAACPAPGLKLALLGWGQSQRSWSLWMLWLHREPEKRGQEAAAVLGSSTEWGPGKSSLPGLTIYLWDRTTSYGTESPWRAKPHEGTVRMETGKEKGAWTSVMERKVEGLMRGTQGCMLHIHHHLKPHHHLACQGSYWSGNWGFLATKQWH